MDFWPPTAQQTYSTVDGNFSKNPVKIWCFFLSSGNLFYIFKFMFKFEFKFKYNHRFFLNRVGEKVFVRDPFKNTVAHILPLRNDLNVTANLPTLRLNNLERAQFLSSKVLLCTKTLWSFELFRNQIPLISC